MRKIVVSIIAVCSSILLFAGTPDDVVKFFYCPIESPKLSVVIIDSKTYHIMESDSINNFGRYTNIKTDDIAMISVYLRSNDVEWREVTQKIKDIEPKLFNVIDIKLK